MGISVQYVTGNFCDSDIRAFETHSNLTDTLDKIAECCTSRHYKRTYCKCKKTKKIRHERHKKYRRKVKVLALDVSVIMCCRGVCYCRIK